MGIQHNRHVAFDKAHSPDEINPLTPLNGIAHHNECDWFFCKYLNRLPWIDRGDDDVSERA